MPDRCEEIIAMMLNHQGYGYRNIDPDLLRAFVRYEYDSNRWAMITNQDNEILGWISWYCFDHGSLEKVRMLGLSSCFYQNETLLPGKHVYFCNTVVREGADKSIFRKLWTQAVKANPDAQSLNAHLLNRDSPVWRWFSRSAKYQQEKLQ